MDYILKNQMTLAEAQSKASASIAQEGGNHARGHHASPAA